MDGQQHIYHGESLESTMKMGTATENTFFTWTLHETGSNTRGEDVQIVFIILVKPSDVRNCFVSKTIWRLGQIWFLYLNQKFNSIYSNNYQSHCLYLKRAWSFGNVECFIIMLKFVTFKSVIQTFRAEDILTSIGSKTDTNKLVSDVLNSSPTGYMCMCYIGVWWNRSW